MSDLDLAVIAWAIREIRELDELCRGHIGGYASLDSSDMDKIHLLERMVAKGASGKKKVN